MGDYILVGLIGLLILSVFLVIKFRVFRIVIFTWITLGIVLLWIDYLLIHNYDFSILSHHKYLIYHCNTPPLDSRVPLANIKISPFKNEYEVKVVHKYDGIYQLMLMFPNRYYTLPDTDRITIKNGRISLLAMVSLAQNNHEILEKEINTIGVSCYPNYTHETGAYLCQYDVGGVLKKEVQTTIRIKFKGALPAFVNEHPEAHILLRRIVNK